MPVRRTGRFPQILTGGNGRGRRKAFRQAAAPYIRGRGGSELEAVAAPSAVDQKPFHRRPVDYRVMVGRVVVRAGPLAHDAYAFERRYTFQDALRNPLKELRAVPSLNRMRLVLVVASEHKRSVRALLEIRASSAEHHRAVEYLDRLRNEDIVALRVDRKLDSDSRSQRRRPWAGREKDFRRVPLFPAFGDDALNFPVFGQQFCDWRIGLYLRSETRAAWP